MGSSSSKPEFATVLADQHVEISSDITLQCEGKTEGLTAIWERNGQTLHCVYGKHSVDKRGKLFILTIKNAEEQDEGQYTLTLKNKGNSVSCSATVTVELEQWRQVEWNQAGMIDTLRAFKIRNDEVKQLQFLVFGPVGAGKSSLINTIKSIFEGRLCVNYLAASELSESVKSQTIYIKKCEVGNGLDGLLPFTFSDVMGVEKEDLHGVHPDDIISALKGHVKDGYPFNPNTPLTEHNDYYLKNPSLKNRIHCLVNVVQADKLTLIKEDFLIKMKKIREEANKMDLLQVVFMTKVDAACPLTKESLQNIYKSKKIKKKIEECSVALGVPENCIFPVKNYHNETEINEDINCLVLHALTKIVPWAHDQVDQWSGKQESNKL